MDHTDIFVRLRIGITDLSGTVRGTVVDQEELDLLTSFCREDRVKA